MDIFDSVHQFGGVFEADLDLDRRTELGGFPERVVQVWKFFEVNRLEIIGPEDQQLFLCNVRLFLFDRDVA